MDNWCNVTVFPFESRITAIRHTGDEKISSLNVTPSGLSWLTSLSKSSTWKEIVPPELAVGETSWAKLVIKKQLPSGRSYLITQALWADIFLVLSRVYSHRNFELDSGL